MCIVEISVQSEDFNVGQEYELLRTKAGDAGAVTTFSGLVREYYDSRASDSIKSLTLEHYPGMTEKSLADIAEKAQEQWPLLAIKIIHRVGKLLPGEQIVLVATASSHRQAAFDAAQYIMDYLKSHAPFWKKQETAQSSEWVEARVSDAEALERWKQ